MTDRNRAPRAASLRRAVAAAGVASIGLSVLLGTAPAASADPTPTTQQQGPSVKFFVVPAPQNGKTEFLFDIAQQTLGDGNRFPEIVELNRGRLQPDGGALDSPDAIEPGWILQLPPDAKGTGVQFGPLPQVTPPTPTAASAQPVPPRSAATPTSGHGPDELPWLAVAVGGGVVASAGAGFWLYRRRSRKPAVPQPEGQPVFERLHPQPQLGQPLTPVAPPPVSALPERIQLAAPSVPVPVTAPAPASSLFTSFGGSEPVRPEFPHAVGVPFRSGAPRLVVSTDEPPQVHEVAFRDDRLVVRLRGAAEPLPGDDHAAEAATWRPLPYDAPASGVQVYLGTGSRGCLFVDIARAAGPIVVTGSPEAARDLAESLLNQLVATAQSRGLLVTLVGQVAARPPLSPCVEHLADLASLPPVAPTTRARVLFTTESSTLDALIAASPCRLIPLVLGDMPDPAWSFNVAGARSQAAVAAEQFVTR